MSTILLVTHPGIGSALREAAETTLKTLPCIVTAVDCPQDTDLDALMESTLKTLNKHTGDIIIFSDVFGATPHNLAQRIAETLTQKTHLISGVNLPMLLRTLNYITLPLDEACEKAIQGGCKGICDCHHPQEH